MTLRRAHVIVGLVSVAAFIGTGIYMRATFPELHGGNELIRSMYRSNHAYILMGGLINLLAGRTGPPAARGVRSWIGRAGVALLLAVPLILIAAFFIDPPNGNADRPLTALCLTALALGVVTRLAGTERASRA